MDSKQLRKKFIKFFKSRDHKLVPSASLVPENDPSVLFTTAGMQQFKDYYIQPEKALAKNIVTSQLCFRTSDIEEVGDSTHLTFFEMLGNFSFGGYGKEEAIKWAYEFLTRELEIAPDRIWCSVFAGDDKNSRDEESVKILEKMGLKYKEHARADNFWGPTGEEGPCGPTVELYVDNIEVWNLVFNEYYKNADNSFRQLETSGVDTGMGLERLLSILGSKDNVYETDLFELVIKKIKALSTKKYTNNITEFRIIADHVKAAVFAINDNILPSNKDRGYIVRRLIRRAVVKASQIGIDKNFTSQIANEVFSIYAGVYEFNKAEIEKALKNEEEKFRQTLREGLKQIRAKDAITGEDLFNFYQSYGIPIEISIEEGKNKNITINNGAMEQFDNFVKKHQDLSRSASAGMFKGGLQSEGEVETKFHTATHLLHSALRKVLGPEVYQKGSNINSERLRFDFSYNQKLTEKQIKEIEEIVNEQIKKDLPVEKEEMSIEKAKNSGAIGVFKNKYADKVKVYSISDISCEICGGPHVKSTSELGHFKIIKEESSSAGVRRIKAILE